MIESLAGQGYSAKQANRVAVQTTVGRLRAAIIDERPVALSQVSYIDFQTDCFPPGNGYPPFLHKALHLSWESEVRLLVEGLLPCTYIVDPPPVHPGDDSIRVGIDLGALIEAVIVAPSADPRQHREVEQLLRRYGVNSEARESNVKTSPQY